MTEPLLIVPAIAWLLASGALNALGEYFSKLWANEPSGFMAFCVAVTYALSSIIWLPALLHRNQLSTMGVAWVLIALISTLLLGLFVFHEQLAPHQWLGVGLAVVAVLLLVL